MYIKFIYNNKNNIRSLKMVAQPNMTNEQRSEMLKYIAETLEGYLDKKL